MKPGSIPTDRVGPILAQLIEERWPEWRRKDEEPGGATILAEKVGCDESSIRAIVEQKNPGCEFDLVDKLLCALGGHGLWYGQLADIYPVKFREKCALHSCNRTFPERGGGCRRRKYCSAGCRELDYCARVGRGTGDRYKKRGWCMKGLHRLTPDNIVQRKNRDRRECKACNAVRRVEINRRYREKQKAAARAA